VASHPDRQRTAPGGDEFAAHLDPFTRILDREEIDFFQCVDGTLDMLDASGPAELEEDTG
jgi:hypothetical protein